MYKLSIIALFASVLIVSAHGGGPSFEKQVGEFIVDVGYDTTDITAGEPVRFDFGIKAPTSTNALPPEFTDVWTRIAPKERGIIFASGIHKPVFGATGMTFTFPMEGEYLLTIRFQHEDKPVLDEVTFPIRVRGEAAPVSGRNNVIIAALVGLVLGFFGAQLMRKRNVA